MKQDKGLDPFYVQKPSDVLAYVSLRFPATYAQIYSALSQIQERIPDWRPKTVLDVGCGPGTGIFAAKAMWPSITSAYGIEQQKFFLTLAEEISFGSKLSVDVTWDNRTIKQWLESNDPKTYDLIIISNVLNELTDKVQTQLLQAVSLKNSGVVLLLEPGTPRGHQIIQTAAKDFAAREHIIAPYINNTFVQSDRYRIHFPQRFQRPEFQRRIRQSMRESELMASDWEETKFCYVAYGTVASSKQLWAQSIGLVRKYRGYLMIPLLTATGVVDTKVVKRHKSNYTYAKDIRWGEIIPGERAW